MKIFLVYSIIILEAFNPVTEVIFSLRRRFLVNHASLPKEECYKAAKTIINDCIRADAHIVCPFTSVSSIHQSLLQTRINLESTTKGSVITIRSRKQYHMNRVFTRFEYYFGQDYVIEEMPVPVEFVSDIQGELKDAHNQVFTRLASIHDRVKSERSKIESSMREYQKNKATVAQNRLRAEYCVDALSRKMQEE